MFSRAPFIKFALLKNIKTHSKPLDVISSMGMVGRNDYFSLEKLSSRFPVLFSNSIKKAYKKFYIYKIYKHLKEKVKLKHRLHLITETHASETANRRRVF